MWARRTQVIRAVRMGPAPLGEKSPPYKTFSTKTSVKSLVHKSFLIYSSAGTVWLYQGSYARSHFSDDKQTFFSSPLSSDPPYPSIIIDSVKPVGGEIIAHCDACCQGYTQVLLTSHRRRIRKLGCSLILLHTTVCQ